QLVPITAGVRRREHDAPHRFDFPSEPQLSIELAGRRAGGARPPKLSGGDEDAERDRQLEAAAFFRDFRGRQIDDDAAAGKFVAAAKERGAHPIATLADHGRRQTHYLKGRQSAGHHHFHLHERRLEAHLGPAEERGDLVHRPKPACGRSAANCSAVPVATAGRCQLRQFPCDGAGGLTAGVARPSSACRRASSAASRARVRSSTRVWVSNSSRVTRSSLPRLERSTARKLVSRSWPMVRSAGGTLSSRRRAISSMRKLSIVCLLERDAPRWGEAADARHQNSARGGLVAVQVPESALKIPMAWILHPNCPLH